jgi:hypothetical protein
VRPVDASEREEQMMSALRGLPGHRGRFRADRTFNTSS